ncbi:hypothetical protein V7101_21190, partial [Bacillus velezensis]
DLIAQSYGSYHIFHSLSPLIMFGWIILAIGAFRAKVLNLLSSTMLGLMSALPLGVLKGTTPFSIVATLAICIALIPLGIKVLREGTKPNFKKVIASILFMIVLMILLYIS